MFGMSWGTVKNLLVIHVVKATKFDSEHKFLNDEKKRVTQEYTLITQVMSSVGSSELKISALKSVTFDSVQAHVP